MPKNVYVNEQSYSACATQVLHKKVTNAQKVKILKLAMRDNFIYKTKLQKVTGKKSQHTEYLI